MPIVFSVMELPLHSNKLRNIISNINKHNAITVGAVNEATMQNAACRFVHPSTGHQHTSQGDGWNELTLVCTANRTCGQTCVCAA